MIITCENCSTSFNLDETFLSPSGSKVRCSKCKHIFTAFPGTVSIEREAPPAEAPVDEPEPAAGVAAATDMAPDSDAAVAGEGVEEEAGVDEDQPEDLDFNIDAALDEALDAVAEPAGEPAAETEEAAEGDLLEDLDLELDMDAEPEAGDEAAGVKAVELSLIHI